MKHVSAVVLSIGLLAGVAWPQAAEPTARYALILEEPTATRTAGLRSVQTATVESYRERVRNAQLAVRNDAASRNLRVTGAAQTVLNAVFVEAPPSRLAELRSMSGVKYVAPLHRFHLHLDRATALENAQAAWSAVGGVANAGAGVKIAIIDTGIDQNHPAFQDSSLQVPAGFPRCTDGASGDCAFTNRKVIVARSYIALLASGVLGSGSADSRPDDVTPRDHYGHGTAQGMITAGATNTGPTGITITGFAPKAWIGNYKVFG
ncbi:MAG TPA: S8 family serine peptidase, partial [Bryobacteraceae bacterium]|nr:S8 family serine peptidase [Bryobacteraceae bacterium]